MKAILVIDDMPNDCLKCPCYRQTRDDGLFEDCKAVLRPLSPAERDEVPEWCPLKPMPKKIPFDEAFKMEDYTDGWNACLEEIEK